MFIHIYVLKDKTPSLRRRPALSIAMIIVKINNVGAMLTARSANVAFSSFVIFGTINAMGVTIVATMVMVTIVLTIATIVAFTTADETTLFFVKNLKFVVSIIMATTLIITSFTTSLNIASMCGLTSAGAPLRPKLFGDPL